MLVPPQLWRPVRGVPLPASKKVTFTNDFSRKRKSKFAELLEKRLSGLVARNKYKTARAKIYKRAALNLRRASCALTRDATNNLFRTIPRACTFQDFSTILSTPLLELPSKLTKSDPRGECARGVNRSRFSHPSWR